MELNDRSCEVLCSHDIQESLTYLFLKPSLDLTSLSTNISKKEQILNYLACCFELSLDWLRGESKEIFEKLPGEGSEVEGATASLEKLLEYLIQCKKAGWKPRMVFIKSAEHFRQDLSTDINPNAKNALINNFSNILIFIELSKITKTGIGFIAYKAWNANWQEALLLCQKADLFYQGLIVDAVDFQALQTRQILPINVIKKANSFWVPKVNEPVEWHFDSLLKLKIKALLEEFRTTSIQPTHLYSF
jgi:hypothetical protein